MLPDRAARRPDADAEERVERTSAAHAGTLMIADDRCAPHQFRTAGGPGCRRRTAGAGRRPGTAVS
ncbi:hypothetical protein, partial [Kitasatospora sp. MY 5-36]|uniref:hypothetical protein n=1 Tax=Kitasatospora sp. MY 5-36 TaxID=1678027 RepID=UPI001F47C399